MNENILYEGFDRLDISKKNRSILRKLGIYTILSLVSISKNEIHEMLLSNKLDKFQNEFIPFFDHTVKEVLFSEKLFRNRAGLLCHDLKIEYFSISLRTLHCLKQCNVNYISEIIKIDDNVLKRFKGIGTITMDEISSLKPKIPSILDDRNINDDKYDLISKNSINIIDEIRTIKDINGAELFDDIYEIFKEEANKNENDVLASEVLYIKLSKQKCIHSILKDFVLQTIEKSVNGISIDQILPCIPKGFDAISILEDILKDLEAENQIFIDDDLYKIKYISIYDFINTIEDETNKKILTERLLGKTLEEIGSDKNLTRERVRQIIMKLYDKRPPVFEDQYAGIYTKCILEKDDFLQAFGVDEYVYYYLYSCYSKGQKSIAECLKDDTLSNREKELLTKITYKDYFLFGTEYVKSQRSDICEYVIKTFTTHDVTYEEFTHLYNSFIKDLGLEKNEKYSIAGRGYENKLAMCDYVLWKYGKKFRYYNMKAYDFEELIPSLNLDRYMDLEISTLLLFKNNLDLMNTYDIRDEYELHNLLKKITKNTNSVIKIHRMPNIEIGNANRAKQVMDLLILNSPIDSNELAKKYEDMYGVMANTVHANYFKDISIYLHDGIYKMDYPIPTDDVLEGMKNTLVQDFYMIANVKKLLESEFPDFDVRFVNAFVLKKIGYKVYSNYIVKDSYQSAIDYFRKLILKDDILDLKNIPTEIVYVGLFQSELIRLKSEYDIVKYLPSKYINFKRLEMNGITKQDLMDYCDFIYNNVKDGEYFTIYSLRNDNIENELSKLGFDDVFYASILAECKLKFQFRRIVNNKLFIKGSQTVQLTNFIEYIILKREKHSMDVHDLINFVKDKYNIILERSKIIESIKGTDVYYDRVYEKIYLNYTVHYEEV